jgi:hypothetical protein
MMCDDCKAQREYGAALFLGMYWVFGFIQAAIGIGIMFLSPRSDNAQFFILMMAMNGWIPAVLLFNTVHGWLESRRERLR